MNEGDANSRLQIYKNRSKHLSDSGITLVKIAAVGVSFLFNTDSA
jgi:hypothetical protein